MNKEEFVAHYASKSLDWWKNHYCPPVDEYITCSDFGRIDGSNGCCWWCMESTPYQWYMCSDESWVRGLMSPYACVKKDTREEAIEFIEQYKQKHSTQHDQKYFW